MRLFLVFMSHPQQGVQITLLLFRISRACESHRLHSSHRVRANFAVPRVGVSWGNQTLWRRLKSTNEVRNLKHLDEDFFDPLGGDVWVHRLGNLDLELRVCRSMHMAEEELKKSKNRAEKGFRVV